MRERFDNTFGDIKFLISKQHSMPSVRFGNSLAFVSPFL